MEDFVTFEIAKKLKEKGFNWICFHYYRTKCKDLFMVFPCEDWSDIEERINAPTISQVLKWLRKKYKIHIVVNYDYSQLWGWTVKYCDGRVADYVDNSSLYYFYEEAALAGIEYVLDNLV